MPEFIKTVPGDPMHLADFPQMCVCGSQSGPMVATGLTYRTAAVGTPVESSGHIYLCRLCVTRAARALGIAKGEEMDRLQNAADELAHATLEIKSRQELIEKMTVTAAERDSRIQAQVDYIDLLQAQAAQRKHLAEMIATSARELTAA